MLQWDKLLNPGRRKDKDTSKVGLGTAAGREELERDFDRILFAAPTRRLADKTQVFPLERNDSVRTRLTHSHEVANLARSIGVRLAFEEPEKVFGANHEELQVKRNIPPLLAAIGLAHDYGNPPFGHEGEVAIQRWFKNNKKEVFGNEKEEAKDFLLFDGNPQTFRLVTRLQILNDDYGLNLTYATLAALLKYPSFNGSDNKGGYKKSGIFLSEKEIAHEVWSETGLSEGGRHPLTHIMEACDDIAYSVLDAEDTVKKNYASFYDLIDHLAHECGEDVVVLRVIEKSKEKNKEFKKEENLKPSEINDLSMQMFRVFCISEMVKSVVNEFVARIDSILEQSIPDGYDLISHSTARALCKALKSFDFKHGYQHRSVLQLELEGSNYIHGLMDMLWYGIKDVSDIYDLDELSIFQKYVCRRLPEGYKRVFQSSSVGSMSYKKAQLIADTVSGMTDSYLIDLYEELKPLYDGQYCTKQS